MDTGKSRNRNQLQDHKGNAEYHAENRHDLEKRRPISVPLHRHHRARTGEEVPDARSDRTHVHKPSERFSSENRSGKTDQDAEHHGISGRSIPAVHFPKPGWKISVPAHGVHQAGGGKIKSHNPGEHGTGNAQADEHFSKGSQQFFRRNEQHPFPCHDAVRPVFQCGRSHGIVACVHKAAKDNGHNHNDRNFFEGEIKLFGRLRDCIKADICPRRNGKGRKNGRKDARRSGVGILTDLSRCCFGFHRCFPVKAPHRLHVDAFRLRRDQG